MLSIIGRYLSLLGNGRIFNISKAKKMTEDVKMAVIFNEEDIQQEFEAFAINIDLNDKPVVDKLKTLCLVNDLSPEDLACEWIAFCSRRAIANTLTLSMLEMFETEHFRKKVNAVREKQKEEEYERSNSARQALEDYGLDKLNSVANVSIKKEVKIETVDDDNCEEERKTNGNKNKQEVITVESPVKNPLVVSDIKQLTVDPESGLPIPDFVEVSYGSKLTNEQWVGKNESFNVKPLDADFHIGSSFKYLQLKRHEYNAFMNEYIEEFADKLSRKLDIASFSRLNENDKNEQLYVGRITTDAEEGKLTAKNLYFNSPPYGNGQYRLNLDNCQVYQLFPGKLVAFKGYFSDDQLFVNEFLPDQATIPEFSTQPITIKTPMQMIIACGPYTLPDSKNLTPLVRLLEHAKLFQPHFLILMGPFFDSRNDYLLTNCDCEEFFNRVMEAVSISLQNTKINAIIIPSVFDLNNYSIYPTPPFQFKLPRVHFMPNPSFLNIDGVIISLSSVDVIRHILREFIEKGNQEGNRFQRVCCNILNQYTLYPNVPNSELNLEYAKTDYLKFQTLPHLFVVPSVLKTFALESHSSVFVNPGYLSKGYFARISVNPPENEYSGTLKEHISVEILKNSTENN